VREWQTLLQRQEHAPIMVTGVFDEPTRAATAAFQTRRGIPGDGVVSSKTWAAGGVAPCFALVGAKLRPVAPPKPAAMPSKLGVPRMAVRGLGADTVDFSFSVVDMKSVVLGAVLGLAAGAVLFRGK
jgi:hypothetical protein